VKANRAKFSTATMCRVLGVSTSGYYAWASRTPSARAQKDKELLRSIRLIHARSRGTYGIPRIHIELVRSGVKISRKRVARLMRQAGLQGVCRRRSCKTTVRDKLARRAPDLVDRNFKAERPDQLWVADITYVPTWAGFLYLAVVLDVWSRRVVGWAMENNLQAELVIAALDMAVSQRRPDGVIHHSDQGCQYTSLAFGKRCREANVVPSMGSVGDCFDNALMESFFATLECELLQREKFLNQVQAKRAIFDYIEGWYNPHRRHSGIDYDAPLEYERRRRLAA